jgi:hypothetical protein
MGKCRCDNLVNGGRFGHVNPGEPALVASSTEWSATQSARFFAAVLYVPRFPQCYDVAVYLLRIFSINAAQLSRLETAFSFPIGLWHRSSADRDLSNRHCMEQVEIALLI